MWLRLRGRRGFREQFYKAIQRGLDEFKLGNDPLPAFRLGGEHMVQPADRLLERFDRFIHCGGSFVIRLDIFRLCLRWLARDPNFRLALRATDDEPSAPRIDREAFAALRALENDIRGKNFCRSGRANFSLHVAPRRFSNQILAHVPHREQEILNGSVADRASISQRA